MGVEAELKTIRLVFLCNRRVRFNELGLKLKVNADADAAADMLFKQRRYYATNGPSPCLSLSLTTKLYNP